MNRVVMLMVLLLSGWMAAPVTQAQTERERGLGPFTLVTTRGEITVRLLRRDNEIVWVDRLTSDKVYVETGVPVAEIIRFVAPRPRLFELAEQPIDAYTPEQIKALHDGLRKMAAQYRPYRDLPGIPTDEAIRIQAGLYEQQALWRDAYLLYADLLKLDYEVEDVNRIRLLTGMCLWRMDRKDDALGYLLTTPIPDDDLAFFSRVMKARADALASTGQTLKALEDRLYLVVFYPFVSSNEVENLAAAIPLYAEMKEWGAAVKTLDALEADYPDNPATVSARELLASYNDQVDNERQFQVEETE